MRWINYLLIQANVDQRVSFWIRVQTCYQVPLKILDKLVVDIFNRFYKFNGGGS